jgi:hypothetical protein
MILGFDIRQYLRRKLALAVKGPPGARRSGMNVSVVTPRERRDVNSRLNKRPCTEQPALLMKMT